MSGAAADVEIRPYEPSDRAGFAQLVATVLAEFDIHVDPILEADLEHPETSCEWVLESAHRSPVGERQRMPTILLDTSTAMTAAQGLYESAGFSRTATRTEAGVNGYAARSITSSFSHKSSSDLLSSTSLAPTDR